jgi:hypothetical protein
MNRLTKAGILILVIGLSFLAATLYRSTSEGGGFAMGGDMFGLKTKTWSIPGNVSETASGSYFSYFLAPRDYRMEVKTNTTIDVYVLDSEGVLLWRAEGKLEPVHSYEGIRQQVVTFHLDDRDDYVFLVYNPSGDAAGYELSVSGYGIETDLLYTSLIIIALGAIVTIASLLPRSSSSRKQSSAKKSAVLPAAVLALIVLSVPLASCATQSSSILAPSWMKEGTYVNYDLTSTGTSYTNGVLDTSKSVTLFLLNGTGIKYNNVTSVIFRWECIHLRGDMATLNVSYSITSDLVSDNFYTSTLVDVNIASRSVYSQNGTLIGTTNLWLPSSPAEGQEIVLWDMPPDKVMANVTTTGFNGQNMYTGQTPQGVQRFFQLENIAGTINGKGLSEVGFIGNGMYEYDTGLMLSGSLSLEPMHTALAINLYDSPNSMTTNVGMGQGQVFINWSYLLGLAAIISSIVIMIVLMSKRRRGLATSMVRFKKRNGVS